MGYNKDMNELMIGVGPYLKPWPIDARYDRELLELGDRRNVVEKYRYWTVDAIKADLDKTRSNLHVAIENWQNDFNIGTIIRNANAFNVAMVHIIGRRHFNRRGAMVTDAYMNIVYHATVDEFVEFMKNDERVIVAIDIVDGAIPLPDAKLLSKSVLVFGSEGPGLSDQMLKSAEKIVMIKQFGSTRSVNVGVASGIAMYAWVQQNTLADFTIH